MAAQRGPTAYWTQKTWATAAAEEGVAATGDRHQTGNKDVWVETTTGAEWIDKDQCICAHRYWKPY